MHRFSLKMGFAVVPVLVINAVLLLAGCNSGTPCQIVRDPACDPTKNGPCPIVCVDQVQQQDQANDAGRP